MLRGSSIVICPIPKVSVEGREINSQQWARSYCRGGTIGIVLLWVGGAQGCGLTGKAEWGIALSIHDNTQPNPKVDRSVKRTKGESDQQNVLIDYRF
jgi:hypothetical protein